MQESSLNSAKLWPKLGLLEVDVMIFLSARKDIRILEEKKSPNVTIFYIGKNNSFIRKAFI